MTTLRLSVSAALMLGLVQLLACSSDKEASSDLVEKWAQQYEERIAHVCGCQDGEEAQMTCRENWAKAIDLTFGDVTQGCLAQATKDASEAETLALECQVDTEVRFTDCVKEFVVCDPEIDTENAQCKLCRNVYQEELKKCPALPEATQETVTMCIEDGGVDDSTSQEMSDDTTTK